MKPLKVIFVDFNGTMDTPYKPAPYVPHDHTAPQTAHQDHTLNLGGPEPEALDLPLVPAKQSMFDEKTGYWKWKGDNEAPEHVTAPAVIRDPTPHAPVNDLGGADIDPTVGAVEPIEEAEKAPPEAKVWRFDKEKGYYGYFPIPAQPKQETKGDAYEEPELPPEPTFTVEDFSVAKPERKPAQMSIDELMAEADADMEIDLEEQAEKDRLENLAIADMTMEEFDGYLEAKFTVKRPAQTGRARVHHGYYGDGDRGYYGRGASHYDHEYQGLNTTYHYGADKESARLLKELCDKTGAKIVYSTTQRCSGWKACANYLGLPDEYSLGHYGHLGVTPSVSLVEESKWYKRVSIPFLSKKKIFGYTPYVKPRQKEIQAWLQANKHLNVKNFVILDDDKMDDPKMAKHWVSSIRDNHFREAEYQEALRILSK